MKSTPTRLFGTLLCAVSVSVLAAPAFTLTPDPTATGPVKFADDETCREAVAPARWRLELRFASRSQSSHQRPPSAA